MDTIPVTFGKPILSYRSATEAIEGAKNNPRQPKAKADGAILAGRQFIGGKCSLASWALEFTDSRWIDIACEDDEVIWKVVDSPPAFTATDDTYNLRWPTGEHSEVNAKQWLADRVGAEFWQLWVNEGGFHVYLRRMAILSFSPVRRAETSSCVLAVREGG